MTSDSEERGIQQHEEIQFLRHQKPRIGVESLGDIEKLGEEITDATNVLCADYGEDVGAQAVYVCGSFAAGEATAKISDLDVRVVLTEMIDLFVAEMIEEELRTEVGFDIVPDVCGYLDARLATKHPENDTPSVKVWEGSA